MGGHLSQHDMTESVTRRVTADTDLGHASLHSSLITELLQITTARPTYISGSHLLHHTALIPLVLARLTDNSTSGSGECKY